MIPFSVQVFFYRVWMWILKQSVRILPFKEPRLFSGPDSSLELCDAIAAEGHKRILLVTDEGLVKLGLIDAMKARLEEKGVPVTVFDGVVPDPTIALIEQGHDAFQACGADGILAVGGGSSIDAAKIIAAKAKNKKDIRKMEGLFRVFWGIKPLYAVPTTAGTGSEVTIAAVVSDPERQKKMSVVDIKLVPKMAALDSKLMAGLPPHITAATGMDALTHAVEAYISRNALPNTDKHALEATTLIMENLPKVMHNGKDLEARDQMALASYKAGIAFTQAGVGYVHAISHNFGARYHTPHGLANAIVLPYVLDYSKPNCTDRLADLARAAGLDCGGGETKENLADCFIDRIRELNAEFGIPKRLDDLKADDIPGIATAAMKEAQNTYAVPRYMDRATTEATIARMLPV